MSPKEYAAALEHENADLHAKLEALRGAAEELADLVDAIRDGSYTPDSFTTQPVRVALAATRKEGGNA